MILTVGEFISRIFDRYRPTFVSGFVPVCANTVADSALQTVLRTGDIIVNSFKVSLKSRYEGVKDN